MRVEVEGPQVEEKIEFIKVMTGKSGDSTKVRLEDEQSQR